MRPRYTASPVHSTPAPRPRLACGGSSLIRGGADPAFAWSLRPAPATGQPPAVSTLHACCCRLLCHSPHQCGPCGVHSSIEHLIHDAQRAVRCVSASHRASHPAAHDGGKGVQYSDRPAWLLPCSHARAEGRPHLCCAAVRRATAADKEELIDKVSAFIFDCDGVIWRGDSVIDGVPETLDWLRSKARALLDHESLPADVCSCPDAQLHVASMSDPGRGQGQVQGQYYPSRVMSMKYALRTPTGVLAWRI